MSELRQNLATGEWVVLAPERLQGRPLLEAARAPRAALPARDPECPFYHWHVQILPHPRLPGGFELGTRVAVNVLPPEEAAARLREVERQ